MRVVTGGILRERPTLFTPASVLLSEAYMVETKKCKHMLCTCPAREGSDYCSDECEDSKDITDIACNCGHSGCGGKA